MEQDITHILINGQRVGLMGLQDIFSTVSKLNPENEEVIKDEIVNRASLINYIPKEAVDEYRRSLFDKYRQYLGVKIDANHYGNEIRVLGPGCPRCEELMRRVMSVVAELKIAADVQHIHDLNNISEFGPVPTPALIVNGKVVFVGKVPSIKELKDILS